MSSNIETTWEGAGGLFHTTEIRLPLEGSSLIETIGKALGGYLHTPEIRFILPERTRVHRNPHGRKAIRDDPMHGIDDPIQIFLSTLHAPG
jgi:hypothetical protein